MRDRPASIEVEWQAQASGLPLMSLWLVGRD